MKVVLNKRERLKSVNINELYEIEVRCIEL